MQNTTAKDIIGKRIPQFFAAADNGKLIEADQCLHIAIDLQREVKAIERGW